jgi:conjugative relaxase-like TrwC/TraI family protein
MTKAIADAHTVALSEAMQYLAAHAGYTRVHNPNTGEKDVVRLPGLAAIAYQHETSRCGDPHLHTHVIVPNRQARADGQLVSVDGTSLYHEARAAGVIYQATLRRELHQSMGLVWAPVDPSTGMAELAGVDRDTIPPGRGAPPSCGSGPPTTSPSSRAVRCPRHSCRPRRKPPAQPNPKSSPGHS